MTKKKGEMHHFAEFGINCNYQDVHRQCAGNWTGPLLQLSNRPGGQGGASGMRPVSPPLGQADRNAGVFGGMSS